MIKKFNLFKGMAIISILLVAVSCHKVEKSPTTGQNYNDPKNGGFEVPRFIEQTTGPGLVLIEGGSFCSQSNGTVILYGPDRGKKHRLC